MKTEMRPCPECGKEVPGVQKSQDKNWYWFKHIGCDESWGENVKYCIPPGVGESEYTYSADGYVGQKETNRKSSLRQK